MEEPQTIPFKNLHSREYHGHKKKVHSVAWNWSGTKLASGSVDQTARIWHIEPHSHRLHLQRVDTLMAHTAGCYCIAIDPLGRYSAVGSAESLVSLWDIKDMLCGNIASASEDLFIDIANVQTGRTIRQIPCRVAMNRVEWNPNYSLLAYAGDDKINIRLTNVICILVFSVNPNLCIYGSKF